MEQKLEQFYELATLLLDTRERYKMELEKLSRQIIDNALVYISKSLKEDIDNASFESEVKAYPFAVEFSDKSRRLLDNRAGCSIIEHYLRAYNQIKNNVVVRFCDIRFNGIVNIKGSVIISRSEENGKKKD